MKITTVIFPDPDSGDKTGQVQNCWHKLRKLEVSPTEVFFAVGSWRRDFAVARQTGVVSDTVRVMKGDRILIKSSGEVR